MCFQMCLQVTCKRSDEVTLAAFVCFFASVRFYMSHQIARLRVRKVTLAAFVWLLSDVHEDFFMGLGFT